MSHMSIIGHIGAAQTLLDMLDRHQAKKGRWISAASWTNRQYVLSLQTLTNAKLKTGKRSKNRADWEKSIKEAKVRIGLQCHLGRRIRIRIRRHTVYSKQKSCIATVIYVSLGRHIYLVNDKGIFKLKCNFYGLLSETKNSTDELQACIQICLRTCNCWKYCIML